jgi:ABC-type bacteriocin/lantibiotic exporter with double-glycine peptidase domain
LLSGLILAFTQSWQIALTAMASSPLIVICSILKSNQVEKDAGGSDASEGIGIVQETVTNIRTVRALNIEDVLVEKLEKV